MMQQTAGRFPTVSASDQDRGKEKGTRIRNREVAGVFLVMADDFAGSDMFCHSNEALGT